MRLRLMIYCVGIIASVLTGLGIAQDVAPPTTTWYKSPMLAVMTGFVYEPLSQYSFEEWQKNLGSEFNADEFVGKLKESGVDYLIYYDKWIDGFVWHDTKTTTFKSSRDFIKEVSQACHKHDLKLVIYFNPVCDGNPEFSKWAIKDRFGNDIPFLFEWPISFGNLHDPDFRKATLEQLTELVSNYGTIDGIWLDIFLDSYNITFAARNQSVIQDFERKCRKSIDKASFDEIWKFSSETRAQYLEDARKISKKFQKDTVFTINGSLEDNTYIVNKQLDYWMTESCTLDKTDFHAHHAHFCPRPTEIGTLINKTWFVPLENDPPPLGRDSEKQVTAEAALALCRGASIYLASTPGHSGQYGRDLQAVHETGRWYKKVKPYLENAQACAEVAVILGTPAEGKTLPYNNDFWINSRKDQCNTVIEAISLCEDLETAGYLSNILFAQADYSNWPGSLSSFKAVVLPERVMLDAKHVDLIRDYVRNGGSLISFGHASCLDENGNRRADFALGDVFAVQEVKWKATGGKIFFKEPSINYFDGQTFDTLANIITINTGHQAEVIATVGAGSSVPAVVRTPYGKGKSFYVATGEAAFRGNRTFWKGLTKMTLGDPGCKIDNDEIHERLGATNFIGGFDFGKKLNRYCIILNESPKGKVLHVIDREGGSNTITVTLTSEAIVDADRATLIETNQNIPLIKKDNRFEITVPCDPVASIVFVKQ